MFADRLIAIKRFLSLVQPERKRVLEQPVNVFLPNQSLLAKILYLVNLTPKIKHLLAFAVALIAPLFFLPLSNWVLFAFFCLILVGVLLWFLAVRSVNRFRSELPFFLMSLKSMLKAGVDCVQAIDISLENFDKSSLLRREFELFISNIKRSDFKTAIKSLGSNLAVSVSVMGAEIKVVKPPNSLGLLKNALWISSQEGASLTDFLDRIVSYCRISENFSHRVKSATIMQLISGYLIAGLSVLPLANKYFFNRDEFFVLVKDPVGLKLIMIGLSLVAVGLLALNIVCSKKL